MPPFYFGGSDSSGSDDENPLPYPKPLARSAFLTANFSPTEFLSSLHNRHQTLEDLRSELRTRSQELNKELLDLVNNNYQDFLSLGGSLKGGDEKVEEVRLGLLGFKGGVETLQGKIEARRREVESLVTSRRDIARKIRIGKGLLEVESRLEELEKSLRVDVEGEGAIGDGGIYTESEDESEDEEDSTQTISMSRLKRRVQKYILLKRLISKIGSDHPFLVKLEERVLMTRQTLLLDLDTALVQNMGRPLLKCKSTTMAVLNTFREMEESTEAVHAIKRMK